MKKIIFLILLTYLFSDLNLYCEETTPEIKNIPKKSYAIAFTGSLISPVIGHSYIGGKNIERGLLYTGGELFNFLASIPPIDWGSDAKPDEHEFDKGGLYWIAAIHLISAIDAMISVHDFNTGTLRKSYFISTAGSAVLPAIGHRYLGEKNYGRGAYYSIGEAAAFFADSHDYIMGIRILSMVDALYSTKKFNDKNLSIILLPGTKSARILISKSF
jgi:hypothetical protein